MVPRYIHYLIFMESTPRHVIASQTSKWGTSGKRGAASHLSSLFFDCWSPVQVVFTRSYLGNG